MRLIYTKRIILFLTVFGVSHSLPLAAQEFNPPAEKIIFRLVPQFGVIGKLGPYITDNHLVKRTILILPEGDLDIQFAKHWYATVSFMYARVRGNLSGRFLVGTDASANANVYGPTAGIKYIAYTENPDNNDFIDNARYWFGIAMGPYITKPKGSVSLFGSSLSISKSDVDFGFNVGAGLDYYFSRHIGTGFQIKLHYVDYSLDDYIIFTFGPQLIMRF